MHRYRNPHLQHLMSALDTVDPFVVLGAVGAVIEPATEALTHEQWDLFSIDDMCANDDVLDRARCTGIDVAYNVDGMLCVPMRDDDLAPGWADDLDASLAYLVSGGRLVQLPDTPSKPEVYRWYPVLDARSPARFKHAHNSALRPLGGGLLAPSFSGRDTYLGTLFGYRFGERDDAYVDLYLRTTEYRDFIGVRSGNDPEACFWTLARDLGSDRDMSDPHEVAHERAKRWGLLRVLPAGHVQGGRCKPATHRYATSFRNSCEPEHGQNKGRRCSR